MPKVVELIGPSGVGKSSLYFSLQKEWNEDDDWAIYHDFMYRRRKWSPEGILLKIKSIFYAVSQSDYFWNEGKMIDQKKDFSEKYPEFVQTFLDLIHEHTKEGFNGEDKRFQVIFFMLKSIERVNSILESGNNDRICLIDEGLVSRLMHLNSPTFSKRDVDRYISRMPLPQAIIYLNTDAIEILNRIKKRKKTSTIHSGLTEQEIIESTENTQELIQYALNKVEESGVEILRLSAEESVKRLTEQSIGFFKQLQK